MRKKQLRIFAKDWCALEVELSPEGRLSICGVAGVVMTEREARREALAHWESFFEESPTERHAMNDRFGKNFRTARGAARFVIASDGEYHGLDLYHGVDAPDGKVLVGHSWGQIRETLLAFFPEVEPYLKWHLNDLKAACEHQEARGETWETHAHAECGNCGHFLGHAWLKRELPPEVIAWAEGL